MIFFGKNFPLLSILVIACSAFPNQSIAAPPNLSKLSLVAGCRIHKIDGTLLKQFVGNMCLFMNDGHYVTADAERIVMYAPDKTEVWRIPGHFHHQMNWSYDGKSILVLSSKFVPIDGKTVRVDVLRRIDLSGKITGEISSDVIFEKLKIKRSRSSFNWEQGLKDKVDLEISHFNSFHEIPPQDRASKNPNIVAGNYIASSTGSGTVLIDNALKVPLEKITYSTSIDQLIHDVQLMKNGQILLLNNDHERDKTKSGRWSSVEFFDPVLRKTTYSFSSSPPEMFYTPSCGGVQQLGDGLILISHISNAFFFLDSKSKKILRSDVLKDEHSVANMISIQEIKAHDLTEFLKKW